MDERDWLAQRFQEHRPRLRALAYRMLGSMTEADDAVQEAWIRLSRSNAGEIDNLEAWLLTVVGRVALNMLRSRKRRGEEPLEAHLPDSIVDRADGIDPENEALLADSVVPATAIFLRACMITLLQRSFCRTTCVLLEVDLLVTSFRLLSLNRKTLGGAET